MVEEIIKRIKAAEKEAEELVKNAQTQARQILAAAEAEAEAIHAEAVKAAKEMTESMKKEGEEKGTAEALPLNEQRQREIQQLKEAAKVKMEAAVAMITERIVKSDGNS